MNTGRSRLAVAASSSVRAHVAANATKVAANVAPSVAATTMAALRTPAAGSGLVHIPVRTFMPFVGANTNRTEFPFGRGRKRNRVSHFRPGVGNKDAFHLAVITPHDEAAFEKYRKRVAMYQREAAALTEKERLAQEEAVAREMELAEVRASRDARKAEEAKANKKKPKKAEKGERKVIMGARKGKKGWLKPQLSEEEKAFLDLPEA